MLVKVCKQSFWSGALTLHTSSVYSPDMSKRLNIMLPEKTIAVLDRVAPKGRRSSFISKAVLHFVESEGKRSLRQSLKAGYQANADESLEIAAEGFTLEEEAWQKSRATSTRKK